MQWVFEDTRAPAGVQRLTVDFGLLSPQGYKPTVVRAFRLEPKPMIFGKNTVAQAWGPPDAIGTQNKQETFFYKSGLVVIFDRGRGRHGADDVHAAAARRASTDRRRPRRAQALAMIDHLLALDPGGRGIAAFFVRGGAAAAARALRRAGACSSPPASRWAPVCPRPTGRPATACARPRAPRGWARR